MLQWAIRTRKRIFEKSFSVGRRLDTAQKREDQISSSVDTRTMITIARDVSENKHLCLRSLLNIKYVNMLFNL